MVRIGKGYIPLPYYVLQQLPFYDWGRTPGRAISMTMLALSVLAACGAAVVLRRVNARVRPLVALGLLSLIVFDSLFIWPWPMANAHVPVFYHQLAGEETDYAVLDFPLWQYRCNRYQLYYAAYHGHRVVGGSVSRRSPQAEAAMQSVEQLVQPSTKEPVTDLLADLGIRYVVLHKLCLDEQALASQTQFLTARLREPIYDDEWIRAFRVPGDPQIDDCEE